MRPARNDAAVWPTGGDGAARAVHAIALGAGLELVMSRLEGGAPAAFRYEEPEDVVAVAIHLKGGAVFHMDGARFTTRPGEVWAGGAPRNSASAFWLPESGFETVSLRMSSEFAHRGDVAGRAMPAPLRQLGQTASDSISVRCFGHASAALTMLARAMLASSADTAANLLFLESCSQAFLAALDRNDEPTRNVGLLAHSKLEDARAILEDRYVRPPTIAALALAVGTNEFTLKRAFKLAYGTTIHGYVRRYRMDRAADRLHQGASVQEAAGAVGYDCPRCFADAFRRTLGVLPSAMSRRDRLAAPARHG